MTTGQSISASQKSDSSKTTNWVSNSNRLFNSALIMFTAFVTAHSLALCNSSQLAWADAQAVITVLSQRGEYHGLPSRYALEQLAGGENQLVELLLEYRTKEDPPFVGIRAEKILLGYAGRTDVQQALSQDVQSQAHTGLARVIGMHIDEVSDSSSRQSLARQVLSRSATDPEFARYGRQLLNSTDSNVRALAKQSIPQ